MDKLKLPLFNLRIENNELVLIFQPDKVAREKFIGMEVCRIIELGLEEFYKELMFNPK